MARAVKEKRIGDVTYRVHMMQAVPANELAFRFAQIFGDTLGGTLKDVDSDDVDQIAVLDFRMRAAGSALMKLSSSANVRDLRDITAAMLQCTECVVHAGEKAGKFVKLAEIIDEIHAGRLVQHNEWLLFALEANFGDFFGEGGPIGKLQQMVEKAFQSPSASTGGSTGSPAAGDTPPA